MATKQIFATATYHDTWSGKVTLHLVKSGRGFNWECPDHFAARPNYRTMPTIARAVRYAQNDRRFSAVHFDTLIA